MDKLQLVKRLAELNPRIKIKDADLAVKVILEIMSSSLAKGGRVEIRGFGTFSLSTCSPQQKINPIFGIMKVPVKYMPLFKPAKELRERVDAMAETQAAIESAIQAPCRMSSDRLDAVAIHDLKNAVQVLVPTSE